MHPTPKDDPPTLGELDDDGGAASIPFTLQLDGMPGPSLPVIGESSPPALMSAENSPCMRGPCVHLMRGRSLMGHGNTDGSLDKEPTGSFMYCSALKGTYVEFDAETYPTECNRWDPMHPAIALAQEKRRETYYEAHPEHRPVVVNDVDEKFDQTDTTGEAE